MSEDLIFVPRAGFASDDELKAKREELKRKLLAGERIVIRNDGNVIDDKSDDAQGANSITVPAGKLAADDEELKRMRQELKRKLFEGAPIVIGNGGNVMNPIVPTGAPGQTTTTSSIIIPKGKLASLQWYEKQPHLLDMEKSSMAHFFPNFQLDKLNDGRLYWYGALDLGVFESKYKLKKRYTVMAVYQNNHPHQEMGSSVHVYLVNPEVEDIINECGFRPSHLLTDSAGQIYLCTAEADDVKTGTTVTTAASVLAWATKWLMCYELVLTGELTPAKFNEHHGV